MPGLHYIYLLPVIPAAFMAISDMRTRTVSLPWLVLSTVGVVTAGFVKWGFVTTLSNGAINISVFLLMIGSALIYWKLRYGRFVNPVDSLIGIGDLIFLGSWCFLFEMKEFVVMLLISMSAGLGWWACIKLFTGKDDTVPLVSCAGGVLILYLLKEAASI